MDFANLLHLLTGGQVGTPMGQPQQQPPMGVPQMPTGQPQPPMGQPPMGQLQQAPTPPGGDILVRGSRVIPPNRHELITGGTFQTGHTGANILGLIGDAFRAQGGLSPLYAPKLQQAREAEALADYNNDPEHALKKLTQMQGSSVLPAFNTLYDNKRADAQAEDQHIARGQDLENAVHQRVSSMLYAADKSTYPQVLARAKAYAEAKGVQLELPDTYEDARQFALGDVPVGTQLTQQNLAQYREDSIARQAQADANRNTYYNRNAGIREQHYNDVKDVANRNADSRGRAVDKAPDRSKWTQPTRAANPTSAPAKFILDPAKGVYVRNPAVK